MTDPSTPVPSDEAGKGRHVPPSDVVIRWCYECGAHLSSHEPHQPPAYHYTPADYSQSCRGEQQALIYTVARSFAAHFNPEANEPQREEQ